MRSRLTLRLATLAFLAAAVALIGVFAASTETTAGAPRIPTKVVQFTVAGNGYKPNVIRIAKNTSVTFVNVDTDLDHTVTKSTGPGPHFHREIVVGKNWIKKFALPGTYKYICSFHSNMSGTVIVRN